jgi:hypothetical protein
VPTPFSALPAPSGNASGRSSNGTPISSEGAGRRGYIRVTGERIPVSAAPPRPETRTRASEDSARTDAASGRVDSAIDKTTAAIDNGRGGDTAWRYQQRALLHLERGDNREAIDDFQTAIAAYRDQISRNVRPNDAQAGITACHNCQRLEHSRMNKSAVESGIIKREPNKALVFSCISNTKISTIPGAAATLPLRATRSIRWRSPHSLP